MSDGDKRARRAATALDRAPASIPSARGRRHRRLQLHRRRADQAARARSPLLQGARHRRPQADLPAPKTQFHKIDLTLPTADADLAAIWKREGVDTVVHAAFLSSPTHAAAWAHELESIGTMHVLNAVRRVPACASWSSGRRRWSTARIRSTPTSSPRSTSCAATPRARASSRTRSRSERQVRRFRRENPDTIVTMLRTAATLGPDHPQLRHALLRAAGGADADGLRPAHAVRPRARRRRRVRARRRRRPSAASSTSSATACCPTRRSWR